jgi:Na+/phosphate symporter
MSGTLILLQLGGYVGLLLWGTHMVTTASSAASAANCVDGLVAAWHNPTEGFACALWWLASW